MTTPSQLLATYVSQAEMSNFFINNMGIFNVKSYGVTVGSTVPQTSNLETCIDAAVATGASFIYFPTGTYLTTTLSNADQVSFYGDNASFSADGAVYPIVKLFSVGIESINDMTNPNDNIDILSGTTDIIITTDTVEKSITIGLGSEMTSLISVNANEIVQNTTNISNLVYSMEDLPAVDLIADFVWDSTRISTISETMYGSLKKIRTYEYTVDNILESINTKIYENSSIALEKQYTDTYTYTGDKISRITRTII